MTTPASARPQLMATLATKIRSKLGFVQAGRMLDANRPNRRLGVVSLSKLFTLAKLSPGEIVRAPTQHAPAGFVESAGLGVSGDLDARNGPW